MIASGDALGLAAGKRSNNDVSDTVDTRLTLSEAPVLDRNKDGKNDYKDVTLAISKSFSTDKDGVVVSQAEGDYNAAAGTIIMNVRARTTGTGDAAKVHGLLWGDELTVTYRGTGPDPAKGLTGVPNPSGKQVSPTEWTFNLKVTRNDRFAVTADVTDANNMSTGGRSRPCGQRRNGVRD